MKMHYECWVTHERIDSAQTACHDCHTMSCPVNTGQVPEPQLVRDSGTDSSDTVDQQNS